MKKEFNLNEKIRELDLKVINDEISLLVFLNLRTDLDKEFIKRLKEDFKTDCLWTESEKVEIMKKINKHAGKKLT